MNDGDTADAAESASTDASEAGGAATDLAAIGDADLDGTVIDGLADPATAAVFRAFFVGGRLQTMPAKRSKRLLVLDHIARVFEPGVRYPESDVNTILLGFHPDFAMLRRYLVDEQFLTRDHGIYWRIGGSVDV